MEQLKGLWLTETVRCHNLAAVFFLIIPVYFDDYSDVTLTNDFSAFSPPKACISGAHSPFSEGRKVSGTALPAFIDAGYGIKNEEAHKEKRCANVSRLYSSPIRRHLFNKFKCLKEFKCFGISRSHDLLRFIVKRLMLVRRKRFVAVITSVKIPYTLM